MKKASVPDIPQLASSSRPPPSSPSPPITNPSREGGGILAGRASLSQLEEAGGPCKIPFVSLTPLHPFFSPMARFQEEATPSTCNLWRAELKLRRLGSLPDLFPYLVFPWEAPLEMEVRFPSSLSFNAARRTGTVLLLAAVFSLCFHCPDPL